MHSKKSICEYSTFIVDKTEQIKNLLKYNNGEAFFLTYPPRSGKRYTMDMTRHFLEIENSSSYNDIYDFSSINTENCNKYYNLAFIKAHYKKHPIIFLDFERTTSMDDIVQIIFLEFLRHSYLKEFLELVGADDNSDSWTLRPEMVLIFAMYLNKYHAGMNNIVVIINGYDAALNSLVLEYCNLPTANRNDKIKIRKEINKVSNFMSLLINALTNNCPYMQNGIVFITGVIPYSAVVCNTNDNPTVNLSGISSELCPKIFSFSEEDLDKICQFYHCNESVKSMLKTKIGYFHENIHDTIYSSGSTSDYLEFFQDSLCYKKKFSFITDLVKTYSKIRKYKLMKLVRRLISTYKTPKDSSDNNKNSSFEVVIKKAIDYESMLLDVSCPYFCPPLEDVFWSLLYHYGVINSSSAHIIFEANKQQSGSNSKLIGKKEVDYYCGPIKITNDFSYSYLCSLEKSISLLQGNGNNGGNSQSSQLTQASTLHVSTNDTLTRFLSRQEQFEIFRDFYYGLQDQILVNTKKLLLINEKTSGSKNDVEGLKRLFSLLLGNCGGYQILVLPMAIPTQAMPKEEKEGTVSFYLCGLPICPAILSDSGNSDETINPQMTELTIKPRELKLVIVLGITIINNQDKFDEFLKNEDINQFALKSSNDLAMPSEFFRFSSYNYIDIFLSSSGSCRCTARTVLSETE